jgi:tetratricopeptide (TPR) repeat protein
MSFISWVKSILSHRGKALATYRSGMAKASQRDYAGAIADYSVAIESPDIPLDVKAMAVYNRALAYSAIHQHEKAAEDLAALMEMPGLPENIRTAAQQRRERIRRRNEKPEGE